MQAWRGAFAAAWEDRWAGRACTACSAVLQLEARAGGQGYGLSTYSSEAAHANSMISAVHAGLLGCQSETHGWIDKLGKPA